MALKITWIPAHEDRQVLFVGRVRPLSNVYCMSYLFTTFYIKCFNFDWNNDRRPSRNGSSGDPI
jgi:hypothetical protein